MGSTSETGHAKNVANFESLISFCTGYGVKYAPTKASIKLANLILKKAAASASIITVNEALPAWQNAVGARQVIFDPLSKLITKVVNGVSASEVTAQYIKDVKTIARKLQGRRATPAIVPAPPLPGAPELPSEKSISASQMSFDNRTVNMEKLNELLASNPAYNPNEPEIKVAVLVTLQGTMVTSNTAVKTAYTPVSNDRITRDVILYDKVAGLVKNAQDVKKYIKSVYGGESAQYKQVSALLFKYPPKE